jgi:hypothetical protein
MRRTLDMDVEDIDVETRRGERSPVQPGEAMS